MIDSQLASFLQEGLGLQVATRDAHLRPSGGRAVALTVEPDGRHIVVYIPEAAIVRLLPDLESNGHAAVSIGRPMDDRACQVKGIVVDIRPAEDAERALVTAQFEGYLAQLAMIGIPRAVAACWTNWPARAVRLKVTAVFEQSPGPSAGHPIA